MECILYKTQDEYIIPYLKQNKGDDGIKNGFSAILEVVANEYNVDVGAETAIATEYTETNNSNSSALIGCGIPFISVIFRAVLGLLEKKKI